MKSLIKFTNHAAKLVNTASICHFSSRSLFRYSIFVSNFLILYRTRAVTPPLSHLTICILTQFSSPRTFFAHVPAKFSARHIFSSFASAIYSLIFNRLCLYSRTACLICLPRVHIQIKLTRLTMCARKTEHLASQH